MPDPADLRRHIHDDAADAEWEQKRQARLNKVEQARAEERDERQRGQAVQALREALHAFDDAFQGAVDSGQCLDGKAMLRHAKAVAAALQAWGALASNFKAARKLIAWAEGDRWAPAEYLPVAKGLLEQALTGAEEKELLELVGGIFGKPRLRPLWVKLLPSLCRALDPKSYKHLWVKKKPIAKDPTAPRNDCAQTLSTLEKAYLPLVRAGGKSTDHTTVAKLQVVANELLFDGQKVPLDLTPEGKADALAFLRQVVGQKGNWISGPDIGKAENKEGVRFDRVYKKLPDPIRELIESDRRKGYRLRPSTAN